jgi:hypothetical protein
MTGHDPQGQPRRTRRDSAHPDPRSDGLRISFDAVAESADERLPAFLARPEAAPVYHGFTILDGVASEGFMLGTISAL